MMTCRTILFQQRDNHVVKIRACLGVKVFQIERRLPGSDAGIGKGLQLNAIHTEDNPVPLCSQRYPIDPPRLDGGIADRLAQRRPAVIDRDETAVPVTPIDPAGVVVLSIASTALGCNAPRRQRANCR